VWVLLAATSVWFVAGVVWMVLATDDSPTLVQLMWVLVMVPAPVLAGAYLMWRRRENSVGELLTLSSICMFVIPTALELPTVRAFDATGAQDWMWAPIWLAQTLMAIGAVLIVALLVVLPDGQIRFRREQRLISLAWVTVILPSLALISNQYVMKDDLSFAGVENVSSPLVVSWLEPYGQLLAAVSAMSYLLILLAIGVLFLRYRTAPDHERKQLRWVLYGGVVAILIAGTPYALGELGLIPPLEHNITAFLTSLPILLFYGSLVVAVMDPPWVDVDIVIRRSLVYGALSFVILLLYIGVAAAFGVVAAENRLSIEIAVILTVVVAVLFQPARRRLQTVADQWVFGARPSRYEAVAEFGESIDEAADPTELLPRLVETIRKTIRTEWVTATLDDGTVAETGAIEGRPVLSVPIGVGGDVIGTIECGPKIRGAIDDDERHLVQTLAAQVGMAVTNARLAGRIVNAAESERRRIERNIHDGAQQELVALVARLAMAKTNAARGTLAPEEVADLQREAQHILTDLRSLAQGIHPTVLSDGGILEAVEERCAHFPLPLVLHAPDWPRSMRFHDDVEGAAYFFISEALANVLKHADAGNIEVTLTRDSGAIHLDVSDDGCGFDPDAADQNGLAGLSDRIQALGGTMSISSGASGGTTVSAEIPAAER
jgi:signal transduction histidine kinase